MRFSEYYVCIFYTLMLVHIAKFKGLNKPPYRNKSKKDYNQGSAASCCTWTLPCPSQFSVAKSSSLSSQANSNCFHFCNTVLLISLLQHSFTDFNFTFLVLVSLKQTESWADTLKAHINLQHLASLFLFSKAATRGNKKTTLSLSLSLKD